jgi:hypothetical protein
MRPTSSINVTGNPNFRYVRSIRTDVGATMRAWLRAYEQAWAEAHEANSSKPEVVQIKRKARG